MGYKLQHIGVYSIRKGAGTFGTSASTCAPSQQAVNLRCRWSSSGVQDSYLHYEAVGDQFVGVILNGLNVHSVEFGAPPQTFIFPRESANEQKKIVSYLLVR